MIDVERATTHILSLNEAWRAGRFEELAEFYHPDVILLPPDAGLPIAGRTAVVASYQEFAEAATLHDFEITSLDCHPFDGATVCHMRFEIEYEIEHGRFRESGLEVYVVTNDAEAARPVIVWRSQAVLHTAEVLPAGPSETTD